MKLKQYAYSSKSVKDLDSDELDALLTKAIEFNKNNDITGFLLYNNGTFIQVLECPEEELDKVLKRITKSTLHQDINKLYIKDIDAREFPDWSMGFKHITDLDITTKFELFKNRNSDTETLAQAVLTYVAQLP